MTDNLVDLLVDSHNPRCACRDCRLVNRNAWDPAVILADWDRRPADCRCQFKGLPGDGLHTSSVGPGVNLPALINAEQDAGACPAELRALQRIACRP